MKYIMIVSCSFCLLASCLVTHAQFTLQGEIRTRSEYRHGYALLPLPDADAAFFISQRSRLKALYKTENISAGIVMQDIRIWGDEEQSKDIPSLGLHEGWVDVPLSTSFDIKLGRQELVYDDHRLLGNSDWTQQARSHDALVLHFKDEGWKVDLGGAYNQKAEANFGTLYMAKNYKVLSYLWLGKEISPQSKFSIITLMDALQKNDTTTALSYRYTYGGNSEYAPGNFRFRETVYGQSGKDQSGKTIAAYMAAFAASYKLADVTLGVGIDVLSGTDASEKEKNKTFNTLYATNHKFYGTMDYFIVLPRDTKNGGLRDIYATVEYMIEAVRLRLDAHHFALAASLADPASPGKTLGKNLGVEMDFSLGYTLPGDVLLQAGYSHMFATQSLEVVQGQGSSKETANWAWAMISVRPTFFSN